jgi:hypothetical protein
LANSVVGVMEWAWMVGVRPYWFPGTFVGLNVATPSRRDIMPAGRCDFCDAVSVTTAAAAGDRAYYGNQNSSI